jgi:hypothetical protein
MTRQDYKHPITPPLELVQQWEEEAVRERDYNAHLATRAAQWGADQELEAIIQLADGSALPEKDRYFDGMTVASLRAARRPKPPSLKEQALEAQQRLMTGAWRVEDWQLISRALEQLPDE